MEIFNQPVESLLDQHNTHIPPFTKLENGETIDHPWYLTGGGDMYYSSFIRAIKQAGKEKYNTAFEWCFGHGRIGWEILTKGLSDHLVFNDCYKLAVETGEKNAVKLGYVNVVRGYHAASISALPAFEKFDLVVGNPPHTFDKDVWIKNQEQHGQNQELIDLSLRLTVDHEWKIHEDFFKHIGHYLADDADIFINNHSPMLHSVRDMAKKYDFILLNNFDKDELGNPQFPVLHFKKI